MDKLIVKAVKLEADGVLRVETNIADNLELAKHVDKQKMEQCLNTHALEMHVYQNSLAISSISYMGKLVTFNADELIEFLEAKRLAASQ